MLDERLQIVLTKEDKMRLAELAKENTGENNSFLIRKLIDAAWKNPKRFGLHAPKAESLNQMMPA